MQNVNMVRTARLLDKDIALLGQRLYSSGRYEKSLFIPTESSRRLAKADIEALSGRVDALDSGIPVFGVLAGHFRDYLESLRADLDGADENPAGGLAWLGDQIYTLTGHDYRADEVRADLILYNAGTAETIWHEYALPALENLEGAKLREALFGLERSVKALGFTKPKLRGCFKSLSDAQLDEIRVSLDKLTEKLQAYIAHTGSLMEKKGGAPKAEPLADGECISVTREEYRDALENKIGVKLDEILLWYEEENAKTRAEALEIANRLDIAEKPVTSMRQISEILFKYAGPCATPEEMFRRANTYLKRTRAAAHEYIWLPEDEHCDCVPVPEQLKDSYPWGGYSSDYPSRYPLYNTMFLNNRNYTAVTDGWIKINSLHEAYPGHHCQFLRCAIDPLPETVKRGAKSVPLSEGVCLRTERAFEFVFAEDPYYPLMVAQRRHHTSTRVKVDLMLNYFGKTIGEACDLYESELGFDRKTARAQVQAHENGKGYFTSYYYGMKKITGFEKKLSFDKKEYTELLFSIGRVGMDTFERILSLSPEDRYSFQHDFASLLQFS